MNANKDISYDEPAKWEILTSANAQTIYFAPVCWKPWNLDAQGVFQTKRKIVFEYRTPALDAAKNKITLRGLIPDPTPKQNLTSLVRNFGWNSPQGSGSRSKTQGYAKWVYNAQFPRYKIPPYPRNGFKSPNAFLEWLIQWEKEVGSSPSGTLWDFIESVMIKQSPINMQNKPKIHLTRFSSKKGEHHSLVIRIVDRCDSSRNLGSICLGPNKTTGRCAVYHLDLAHNSGGRYLIGEIQKAGGDFRGAPERVGDGAVGVGSGRHTQHLKFPDPGKKSLSEEPGSSACWAGTNYESWRAYKTFNAAIAYLERYFDVQYCEKYLDVAKKVQGSTQAVC
jgi:hypothetical protein